VAESSKLVQFGAGAIGRSFIGQLFARGGYEVVFFDVNPDIVDALNERRSYRVEIRDTPPGSILVRGVRAVNGNDREAVIEEVRTARVAGTAVGAGALKYLYPTLAAGIAVRREAGLPPLDVILCENLHDAASLVRQGLSTQLPPDFPLDEAVGLVETSIGKMVPMVPDELRRQDPLVVCAEAFNTLVVDGHGFKNAIPLVEGLSPQRNMPAYVDRKLYVHNLGHAAVAYHAARCYPEVRTIGEAIEIDSVRLLAGGAMRETAAALLRAYPGEWSPQELEDHVQDLLRRFANPALGDTVFRVGRDVPRKLNRHDRIIGAMAMDLHHGITPAHTARVAADAFHFRAVDDAGRLDPADEAFIRDVLPRGPEHVLSTVCGLNDADPLEAKVRQFVLAALDSGESPLSRPLTG